MVTANKALLAEDGPTLYAAAEKHGVDLYYEAAVAGAIPLLRPLRESLVGDKVHRVLGIVNGTTNFVLSRMHADRRRLHRGAGGGQALGYAEADPTADVEGFDAAAKAAILASLAFHTRVTAADVYREGITEVTAADVAQRQEMNSVIKLLAICELSAGRLEHRRAGAPGDDPAHAPAGRGRRRVQRGLRRGRVGRPGHVLRPRRRRRPDRERGARRPGRGGPPPGRRRARAGGVGLRPARRAPDGRDRHPVLHQPRRGREARRARPGGDRFAEHDVSIQTVRQHGHADDATLVVVTHRAPDSALAATVAHLRTMDAVRAVASVMRVEGDLES